MDEAEDGRWTARDARAAFARAPVVEQGAMCPDGSVLVVAPHPDDESLGCGGLIALMAEAGCRVQVAALTDGEASHPQSRLYPPERLAELRRLELRTAVTLLAGSAAGVETFGAPDGRLESREDEAQAWLAGLNGGAGFDAVFVTWVADPHPDHQAAFRIAARQAARWSADLFTYPVWGLIRDDEADVGPAVPCLRLDIASVLDRKRRAIAAHRSQTTDLIEDDPQGFRLTAEDIARHLGPYEVFMRIAGPV